MKYNPIRYNDPITTRFLDMCSMTTPHGHEAYCWRIIPGRMEVDIYNNVHVRVGESRTMFASHLDTANSHPERVWFKFKGQTVGTNGKTVLGADDKAGATIMCHMIEQQVPGWYVFFAGEEQGCIGSGQLAEAMYNEENIGVQIPHYTDIDRCISFDRRGYDSVVTHQMGERCCSDEFAQALGTYFDMEPDSGGVFTDSEKFLGIIPECTNISVGYHAQHTHGETQDLAFLRYMAEACVHCEWDDMPVARRCAGELHDRYGGLWWGGRSTHLPVNTDHLEPDCGKWRLMEAAEDVAHETDDIDEARAILKSEGLSSEEIEQVIQYTFGEGI